MSIMGELGVIFGVCLVGELIAALLPVAFPASVISMVLLMLLLLCGVVKEGHISVVSKFLVANMGICFIPALVGVLDYWDVLKNQLLPFVVLTLVTTPIVYGVTVWSVQLLMKMRKRKGGK